jgi:hypothetical protein
MFGWWLLLLFVGMGLALESMHALKIAAYLDPAHHVRRELWTLAHAHGTLLAIVNLLFASALRQWPWQSAARVRFCSKLFLAAGVLLPAGFFLGGLAPSEGDPSIGVWLVPVGALLLFASVLTVAIEASYSGEASASP